MNARPSEGTSEVPFPRGATGVGDAQRDAALDGGGERRHEPVHRGVARGVGVFFFVVHLRVAVLRLAARGRVLGQRALDRRARRGARAAEPAQALGERAASRRRRRPLRVGDERAFVFFSRRSRVHAVQPGLELLPVVCFGGKGIFAALRRDGRQDESRRARRGVASRVAGGAGREDAAEEQAAPAEDVAPEPQALGRLVPVRQSPRAPQPGDERGRGDAFVVRSPREDLVERREQRRGVVLGAGGGSGDAAEDLPRKREDVSSDVHEGRGARGAAAELEQGAEDVTVPVRRPIPERALVGGDADASVPSPYAIGSPPADEVGNRRGSRARPFFARGQEDEYSAQRVCRARTPRGRGRARAAAPEDSRRSRRPARA